jgi:putative hydrolase of the HAD superfamily
VGMRREDDEGVLDANDSPLLRDRVSEGPRTPHAQHPDPTLFKEIEAVYFDLDDTLCAYWDASKSGLRRAFELHGPYGFTVEECVLAWAAAFRDFAPTLKQTGWYEGYLKLSEPTRTENMRRALHRLGVIDEERAATLSQSYMEERDEALSLFEDAIEVIETLRKKYPLGLITNGPADLQRMEVNTLGIQKYFDHILIEGEMGRGKPKPEVFEHARQLMAKEPHQLLMVGNSYRHDVLAAMNAGWKAIWIRRPSDVPPSAGPEELKPEELPDGHPEPHAVINDLRSLLRLL